MRASSQGFWERLFVIALLFGWIRGYFAEQSVILIVRPGGEIELDSRTRGAIAAKAQSPQAVYGQCLATRVE